MLLALASWTRGCEVDFTNSRIYRPRTPRPRGRDAHAPGTECDKNHCLARVATAYRLSLAPHGPEATSGTQPTYTERVARQLYHHATWRTLARAHRSLYLQGTSDLAHAPGDRRRLVRRPLSLAAFFRRHGDANWCLPAHLRGTSEQSQGKSWVNRFGLVFFHPALGLALHGGEGEQDWRCAAGFRAAAKGGAHLQLHGIHSSPWRTSYLRTSTSAHLM